MKVSLKTIERVRIGADIVTLYPRSRFDVVRVRGRHALIHVTENLYTWLAIDKLTAERK